MEEVFEVICWGGPDDGARVTVPVGRHGWEVWQPFVNKESHGATLIGSYIVEPERTRAVWIQLRKWPNGTL